MKNILYLLLISIITLSCKNDTEEIQETSLIGNWKNIAYISSDGTPTNSEIPVINGYIFKLNENLTYEYENSSNNNCSSGTFTFEYFSDDSNNNRLYQICNDNNQLGESIFTFKNNLLYIQMLDICDEICTDIFERLPTDE